MAGLATLGLLLTAALFAPLPKAQAAIPCEVIRVDNSENSRFAGTTYPGYDPGTVRVSANGVWTYISWGWDASGHFRKIHVPDGKKIWLQRSGGTGVWLNDRPGEPGYWRDIDQWGCGGWVGFVRIERA
jgi:hypothetical protein